MPEIFNLIPKVMAEIGGVAKTRKNEQQKYSFRGIEDMYLAAHPAMVHYGVFCAPEVVDRNEYRFEKINDYGKVSTWIHVALKVRHRFYASDGSYVDVTTCGEGLDNSDKATNKAMSGAMKYALIELFCVPTEDVEDADRTTPETGIKPVDPILEPIVLEAPPVKEPEADSTEASTISVAQQQKLARRFRESLKAEFQADAEELRHRALTAMSLSGMFKSKFIDNDGNPTSSRILDSEFEVVGKALVKAAKSL